MHGRETQEDRAQGLQAGLQSTPSPTLPALPEGLASAVGLLGRQRPRGHPQHCSTRLGSHGQEDLPSLGWDLGGEDDADLRFTASLPSHVRSRHLRDQTQPYPDKDGVQGRQSSQGWGGAAGHRWLCPGFPALLRQGGGCLKLLGPLHTRHQPTQLTVRGSMVSRPRRKKMPKPQPSCQRSIL